MKKHVLVGLVLVALLLPLPFTYADAELTSTFFSSRSDGEVWESDVVYNTAWTAETGHVIDDHTEFSIGQSCAFLFEEVSYHASRGFVFFDTSSIPDGATITSATLSLYVVTLPANDFNVTIQSGQPTYPHDSLVAGDYNKVHYSGNGGMANTSGWMTNGYEDITLNAVGMSWISKTGTTKICLRSSKDISGTSPPVPPPDVDNTVWVRSQEQGIGYKPKLVVTYTVPRAVTFYSTSSDGDLVTTPDPVFDNTWVDAIAEEIRDTDGYLSIGSSHSAGTYWIIRAAFFFDTSSLPDGVTISSTTLSFHGDGDPILTDSGHFDVVVQNGQPTYPHDPLVAGDIDKSHYSGDGGSINTADWNNDGWNSIVLNADGRDWVNSKGTTKFLIRISTDIAGTAPGDNEANLLYIFTNEQGEGYIPTLTVVYSQFSETFGPIPALLNEIIVPLFGVVGILIALKVADQIFDTGNIPDVMSVFGDLSQSTVIMIAVLIMALIILAGMNI